jgi:hypothetical protein
MKWTLGDPPPPKKNGGNIYVGVMGTVKEIYYNKLRGTF